MTNVSLFPDSCNDSCKKSASGMNEITPTNPIIKVFSYAGSDISFDVSGEIMVNATEMAKPFGKSPKDFLRTDFSKRFIDALSERHKCHSSDLLRVIYGNNGGTWMHRDLAIEFARWLSPDFGMWCNDRIFELARFGFTATDSMLDMLVGNPDLIIRLATQVKTYREEKEKAEQARRKAEEEAKRLQIENEEQKPKADYYDALVERGTATNIRDTAKELGIREKKFVQLMIEWGILYRDSRNRLKPTAEAVAKGWCVLKEFNSLTSNYSGNQVLFTVDGRDYLRKRLPAG